MNNVLSRLKRLAFRLNRSRTLAIAKYLLVLVALTGLLAQGSEKLGYHWQWYRIPRYLFTLEDGSFHFGPLLTGLGVTFHIVGISLVMAFLIGLATALMRLSTSAVAGILARLYLEGIRNTPLLIQL